MRENHFGSETYFSRNRPRNWNFTLLLKGTCINQNLPRRTRRIKLSRISKYKDHLIPPRRPFRDNYRKNIAISADHKMKIKEKMSDKFFDLARELRKLWNIRVSVILIIIRALGNFPKSLKRSLEELEVGGRIEIFQIMARKWEWSWRPEKTCCHSDARERSLASADPKTSPEVNKTYHSWFSDYCFHFDIHIFRPTCPLAFFRCLSE